jgi:hypothetical protein
MSRSLLAKAAIFIGLALLLLAALLFANGYLCLFNKASCGMVEPLLALPVVTLGFFVFGGGLLALRRGK